MAIRFQQNILLCKVHMVSYYSKENSRSLMMRMARAQRSSSCTCMMADNHFCLRG